MTTESRFAHQLDRIQRLDFCLLVLVKFLHELWDDPDIEKDIREHIMAIYGDVSSDYQDFHKITVALEDGWQTLYDGRAG